MKSGMGQIIPFSTRTLRDYADIAQQLQQVQQMMAIFFVGSIYFC